MKIFKFIIISFIIIFFISSQILQAQEDVNAQLQQKITEAKEYLNKANEFQNAGEYDKAYEEAQKAKSLTAEISQLKEQMAAKVGADTKIKEAKSLIEKAENLQADKYAPEELASSKSSLLSAENSFAQMNFIESLNSANESVNHVQNCLSKIEQIKKEQEEAGLKKPGEIPERIAKLLQRGKFKLKTTYKVRLIPERRDCLWRIAEYKYIYDNPWKWSIIYKANKNQIKDPDLIYPGQVFGIPELDEKGNPVVKEEGSTKKNVPANEKIETGNE